MAGLKKKFNNRNYKKICGRIVQTIGVTLFLFLCVFLRSVMPVKAAQEDVAKDPVVVVNEPGHRGDNICAE